MTVRNKGRNLYAFVSILLSAWWLFTGAMCEAETGTPRMLMGYPYWVEVKADGCDTILTGGVEFSNMTCDWDVGDKAEYARGAKDEANLVETLEAERLHVTSVYQQKQLHVVVDSNKTGKHRIYNLKSRHEKYEIVVMIYQDAEVVDSVEDNSDK